MPLGVVDLRQHRPAAASARGLRGHRHAAPASWAGCHRLFWDTFAIGVGLWVIGHLGWAFEDLILQRQSWVRWHTIFSLCGGIGPLIALFARPHRGVRAEAVGNVGLVLASYGLLAAFIYSYFILIPGLVPGGTDHEVALFKLVQLNRALLFGTMAIVVVARPADALVCVVPVAGDWDGDRLFLRIITSLAISERAVPERHVVRSCLDPSVPVLRVRCAGRA